MNEQPTGERPGDQTSTDPAAAAARPDHDATTDRSGTDEHAGGGQTGGPGADVPAATGTPSMSMPAGQPAYASPGIAGSTAASASQGGSGGRAVIMVIVALVVGALVGGGVVAATRSSNTAATPATGSSSTPSVTPSEQPSAVPSASPATTVVVPAVCLKLTDDAKAIVDLSTQAAAAARDLKAAKLSSIVRQLDTAQQRLRDDTATCRGAASTAP